MAFSVAGFAQGAPSTAAPTPPAREASDVISIFSDAYTDITVDTFSAGFDDSDVRDTTIAGDAAKIISFTNFLGIDFQSNRQDMSGMTHFHFDLWTSDPDLVGKVFNSKFSHWGGTAGEVSAFTFDVNTGTDPALQAGTWISIDVPIASMGGSPNARDDVAQFVITSNLDGDVFVDNLYLYNDGTGTGGGGGGGGGMATVVENFDMATSVDGWTQAGDAAGKPAEVTFEHVADGGVDGSGAMRWGGTNADGAGGRAYIVERAFPVDFAGATDATVSIAVRSESLVGTNVSALSNIGGNVVNIASLNGQGLTDSEFTVFTFEHMGISDQANAVLIQFNVAAGAAQDNGGTILIDNLTVTLPDDGGDVMLGPELLLNGDFEAGDTQPWFVNFGDAGVPTQTDGGNTFFIADVETAGDAFAVNLSQVVGIQQGETYVLSFDASSSGDGRSIIAGIGLNEAPFTNNSQTVNLTSTNETYTLQLAAANFGIPNSRVLFDMGADTGIVVIDNVSLKRVITDDGGGGGGGNASPFCAETVTHLGIPAEAASAIKLSIFNTGELTMRVEIESANDDPVDVLIVNNIGGPITGSPAVSAVDTMNGVLGVTLTWTGTPPADVDLNVLWSKESFGGNWQLSDMSTTVPFAGICDGDGGGGGEELLTNGDFQNMDTAPWFVNFGDGTVPVQEDGGNRFFLADVETAGDAFAVNLSQVVPIIPGETYTLSFDASSSGDGRSIIAGIGLNEAPFAAATQVVNLTSTSQRVTLELTADGFGIPNSRVLFDLGADTGIVVIDNVSLVGAVATSTDDGDEFTEIPSEISLNQNYPNPFNPTTNISYSIPSSGKVLLEVFNIQGQKIAELVNGVQTSGAHTISFNATNLASGLYLYRLRFGNSVQVRKMLLIK